VDFSLKTYQKLLETLRLQGYSFYTFENYCQSDFKAKVVILRHDVDKKPLNSLRIAKLEKKLNIKSTYYFQIKKNIYKPDIILQIAQFGHEIGYHYNDLAHTHGSYEKAIKEFETNISTFRKIVTVKTIAMHGSPTSKWDNRDIWKNVNYKKFDLIGEPYFDFLKTDASKIGLTFSYITDTGRMWNGDKYNLRDRISFKNEDEKLKSVLINPVIHSTFDFIKWLSNGNTPDIIMITTHPQRWTDNFIEWLIEFITQKTKNTIKRVIKKIIFT